MYDMTTDLAQKLSDILQTGSSAPNHKVTVWRQNKDEAFENMPFVLPEVTRISLDRRFNMLCDELQVESSDVGGYYSPDYSDGKTFGGVGKLPKSGYKNVLKAYNQIQCELGYGESLVKVFTGQIQNVDIAENPPSIRLDALNICRKLLKPVDPVHVRELVYSGGTVCSVLLDLCRRAGIDDFELMELTNEQLEHPVGEIRLPMGTTYADGLKDLLALIDCRADGNRHGALRISRLIGRTQQDFHNWEFDDYVNMTEGIYKYESSLLRNRVVVKSDSGWQAFEDPFLVDYCNGEIISSAVDAPWARTVDERWSIADSYFLDIRRKMRRISVAVAGNPAMDIGDLVKMRMLTSAATGKYMIIGIRSDYSRNGYYDQVDLEYAADSGGHLCYPAQGEYEYAPPGTGGDSLAGTPVVLTLRDKLVNYALTFQRYYYEWYGNAPDSGYGLDSSHFTYQVYKNFGIMESYLDVQAQREWTQSVAREELLPGDLVFYNGGDGRINHVTMYIGNGQIIGANGGSHTVTTVGKARSRDARVKIARLDYRPPASYGRPPALV